MEKAAENNVVHMHGVISSAFEFNHEVFGESFYTAFLTVPRLSGQADILSLMVSERLVDVSKDMSGTSVYVSGQFRSFNSQEDGRSHLRLYVFVRSLTMEEAGDGNNAFQNNDIFLDGYVCKEPIYRKTPLGREIVDILVAVNRPYGKSDYIPCIAWGRNAQYASGFGTGTHIEVYGRIQSREYNKKISETEVESRTAYEVSIGKIMMVEP